MSDCQWPFCNQPACADCATHEAAYGHGDCICGELRAAEQRVTSDFAKYLRHMEEWQAGYNKGHAAGVEQGQRDEREACIAAVEGLRAVTPNLIRRDDALAAIDALEKP